MTLVIRLETFLRSIARVILKTRNGNGPNNFCRYVIGDALCIQQLIVAMSNMLFTSWTSVRKNPGNRWIKSLSFKDLHLNFGLVIGSMERIWGNQVLIEMVTPTANKRLERTGISAPL